jgi:hypothetical protein
MPLSKEASPKDSTLPVDIDHFEESLGWQWWTTDRIKISNYKGNIVAQTNKVGPDWGCFGKNLGGSLNLSKHQVLKFRAKAEGGTKPVEIQFTLRDGEKHETNGKPARSRIPVDGKYREFYINMSDRWIQTWPSKKTVNPSDITDVLVFLNPGGRPFTGTVLIDYIEMIRLDQMPEGADVPPFDGIIDIFDDENLVWWLSDNIDIDIADSAMKVTSNGAGPKYEAIGRSFNPIDFTKYPVVKVRAKVPSGQQNLHLKLVIQDSKENATDVHPMEMDVPADGQYRDYYYSFAGKFRQLAESKGADRQKVNPKDIVQIIVTPNPGGPAYVGDFYIDEVRVLQYDSLPKGVQVERYGMIDNFEGDISSWKASNDKFKLSVTNGMMKVDVKSVNGENSYFSTRVEGLDFENYPFLKFRAKSEGTSMPVVRIDLKDKEGNVTNANPNEVAISNEGNFTEYTISFKGKYKQMDPEKTVMSDSIKEIIFYVNPNEDPYTGTIYLDDFRVSGNK